MAGKEDGNFVSSALSAHLVLSMAAYGAEGSTAREMRQALYLPGLEADDAEAHRGFQSFIDTLNVSHSRCSKYYSMYALPDYCYCV